MSPGQASASVPLAARVTHAILVLLGNWNGGFLKAFSSARSGKCRRKRAAGGNGMSKRILVVEDQPDNRQISLSGSALINYHEIIMRAVK